MIQGYRCNKTENLGKLGTCDKNFSAFQMQAEKRLNVLNAATCIEDLMNLKSNHFEALGGKRKGQFIITINKQWRLCFTWGPNGPDAVEIVDYH